MWISKRKYMNLINRIDEIKTRQEQIEENTERKIVNMAKRILREPGKLSEDLDKDDQMVEYINDIINH